SDRRAARREPDELARGGDRDREPETLGVRRDGRVDPDDVAGAVEQRAAAVAGIDRGVRLDEAVEGRRPAGRLVLDRDLPVEAGDDPARDGFRVAAERAADGDGRLTNLESCRAADRGGLEARGVDLDQG